MKEKTKAVLDIFEKISSIPRQSKNEQEIRRWLLGWAEERGYPHRIDGAGNLIVEVPASPGRESAPTVVLQGHMDMVCEKRPGVEHDFSRDPVPLVYEGDWLHAEGTTLGADNGIGIALAMHLAEDPEVTHPPLELLFTVDEETGLTGALGLGENVLRGRMLLNLDSEEDGKLTVGCAGGRNSVIELPVAREASSALRTLEITVGGLSGGHSGVDIRRNLGNANIILARALEAASAAGPVRLEAQSGGSAHNAIPRDAQATIAVPEDAVEAIRGRLAEFEQTVQAEQRHEDPHLYLAVETVQPSETSGVAQPLTEEASRRVVDLLLTLPHGVFRMSDEIDGLVETSANLATVSLEQEQLRVLVSERSSVPSQLDAESAKINAAVRLAEGTVRYENEYPSWTPNLESPLLARTREVYARVTGEEPRVEAIHAGLEAGVIGAKHEGMEMISVGPTVEGAHSPDERLHVPSVGRVRDVLAELLRSLG
ncbi:MAG: aminoacyl-histidine dipeptidase [Spirochaetaceae bacterium]